MIILGVLLAPPAAYPQNTREQLNQLMLDSVTLRNSMKELKENTDRKNAEMTKLLQDILKEVLTRFNSIDATVQRMNESVNHTLSGLKGNDEKSSREIQETRIAVEALKKNMEEGLLLLQNQVRGLNERLNNLNTEEALPGAAQLFNQAWGEYNAAFYDLAIVGFNEFIKNYPDNERTPGAAFYIGESLLAQKKLDQAAAQFDLVLEKYPTSDRRCIALYRKGQILVEQKQIPQARSAMDNVVKECQGTPDVANAAATDLKTLQKMK
jgi:tol-pal system protein YbgF